jgi:hypothetical protein
MKFKSKLFGFLFFITGIAIFSSCSKCIECTAYDHWGNVKDYEEYCSMSKDDREMWEFNFKSSRMANNWSFDCHEK